MAETIREAELSDQIDTLTRLATVVLNEHTNADGLCAVCGCAFPCDRCSQPREGSSTVRLTSSARGWRVVSGRSRHSWHC